MGPNRIIPSRVVSLYTNKRADGRTGTFGREPNVLKWIWSRDRYETVLDNICKRKRHILDGLFILSPILTSFSVKKTVLKEI